MRVDRPQETLNLNPIPEAIEIAVVAPRPDAARNRIRIRYAIPERERQQQNTQNQLNPPEAFQIITRRMLFTAFVTGLPDSVICYCCFLALLVIILIVQG